MNKLCRVLTILCIMCLLSGEKVLAAGNAAIMETYTGEDGITLYVQGVTEEELRSIQIGTSVCEAITVSGIEQKSLPMQTLIMIDNSLSISEKDRENIEEILQNLIADRLPGEEIAIAVFGEEIQYLTDYSSDYTELKTAANHLTYQDQETYLTDVLYDLITEKYIAEQKEVYRRIIVVSDGVDNKSLGYTKDELYLLLKENPVPVYAIGCHNGKNDEQLENMFAISRITSADSFLLEETENILSINKILNEDRDILEIRITPEAELLDGGRKTIRISFDSGTSLSAEVSMPQKEWERAEEEKEEAEQEAVILIPEAETEKEEKERTDSVYLILSIVLGGMILGGIILWAVLTVRKKKKVRSVFREITPEEKKEAEIPFHTGSGETELLTTSHQKSGNTVLLWEADAKCDVILTDMGSTVRTFQTPIEDFITIGRKDENDIVIDYDKSVSGNHCKITIRNNHFFIEDLQSSNKTFLNGNEVISETELFSGNIIKLGRRKFKFEVR